MVENIKMAKILHFINRFVGNLQDIDVAKNLWYTLFENFKRFQPNLLFFLKEKMNRINRRERERERERERVLNIIDI